MIHLSLPMKLLNLISSGWSWISCGQKQTTLLFTHHLFHRQEVSVVWWCTTLWERRDIAVAVDLSSHQCASGSHILKVMLVTLVALV